ncbi:MAG: glycosyltransferase [Rhodospirillales bacterium]|nr:glycosyltransferase [Rhodospirillales bacterium]
MSDFDPTWLLLNLDTPTLVSTLLIALLLDVPRYTFAFLAIAVSDRFSRNHNRQRGRKPAQPLVTVILAGHNESAAVARCVRSLREQSYRRIEIVCVDDGSSDGMKRELRRLRGNDQIDAAFTTRLRCGQSSAVNLGFSAARGEIILVTDCDCTFDHDAIAHMVAAFDHPRVGAVAGNVGIRNTGCSMLAALQAVEYLMCISIGKRIMETFGQVTCVSGAFGAFRRRAFIEVGGFDSGAGEDLDITLRLRRAGWQIRFADQAWCLTDAPESLARFVRQRLRWERDALRLRLRKHRQTINPASRSLRTSELFHQFEFVLGHVGLTFAFPLYVGWLVFTFGGGAVSILVLVTVFYMLLDAIAVICALASSDRPDAWRLLPYVIIYGPFQTYLVRSVRLYAYVQELVFRRSYHDNYVPARVLAEVPRY